MANEPIEHFDQIDFTRQCKNWGLRGIIMTHIECDDLIYTLTHFQQKTILNNFQVIIRPALLGSEFHCVILEPRSCIDEHIDKALQELLDLLYENNNEIVWKEGEIGYEIDNKANIIKKWWLDDGGC